MITQTKLKELFDYDPETGLFTRLQFRGAYNKVGDIPGWINKQGYLQLSIFSKTYYAHRLAVLYMTGKLPEHHIDHIDGIRNNNKWLNLRECNESQNLQNQKKAQKNNRSTGLLGVYKTIDGNFKSLIMLNRKQTYLGTFKTKEEAHQAYLTAKRQIHEFNTL